MNSIIVFYEGGGFMRESFGVDIYKYVEIIELRFDGCYFFGFSYGFNVERGKWVIFRILYS